MDSIDQPEVGIEEGLPQSKKLQEPTSIYGRSPFPAGQSFDAEENDRKEVRGPFQCSRGLPVSMVLYLKLRVVV